MTDTVKEDIARLIIYMTIGALVGGFIGWTLEVIFLA
jgi:hypothetical protein